MSSQSKSADINVCMQHSLSNMVNHYNNFTALRWLAAGLVLYGHSFVFLGLPEPIFMGWLPLGPLGVYIFFTISGYLVAKSWNSDPDFFRFLKRRVLRIFPGLIVCTFLSVMVLGLFLTELTWREYFAHPHTLGYFSNIILYITYHLPGVFESNLVPNAVNGSLWSLPAEFSLYLLLAVLGFFHWRRITYLFIIIMFMLLVKLWALSPGEPLVIYRTDVRQIVLCGVYFWVGVTFFKYNVSRFFSTTSILGSIIIWLSLSRWPDLFMMASWFILPFLTLAFGLAKSPLLGRMNPFDYSYGIYIYAFPVQQSIAKFWPHMPLGNYLLIVGVVTVCLAALSWHWVEQPALQLKPQR